MDIYYRKRKNLTTHTRMNISKSGVSLTEHAGPISVNSRTGRTTIRLGSGLTFRFNLSGRRR